MSGLNKRGAQRARVAAGAASPVRSERIASGVTHEGGAGYAYDAKSELFLLAVSSFFGEDKFYEKADDGDSRYERLVRQVATEDPNWTAGFLKWLRAEAHIRTAAIVGAAQYAIVQGEASKQRRARGIGPLHRDLTARRVIDSVLQRPDEPGEFVAYWRANVQNSLPGGVQRGVADAVLRLYTERSYLKHDSTRDDYRFADVLNLVHAGDLAGSYASGRVPWKGEWQKDLFAYIVKRPYESNVEIPLSLLTLEKNAYLRQLDDPRAWLMPTVLRDAGMTWEDALSAVGSKVPKKSLWEAMIPSMGYMALLRNLRNFDEAGVSNEVAEAVGKLLSTPEAVAESRQLPMRFLAAYRAVSSTRWAHPLEKALQLSLNNVPELGGRTLILVDTSSSMEWAFSKDGTVKRWDAAVLFALALAQRCETPEVVSFSSAARYTHEVRGARTKTFDNRRGASLLPEIVRWQRDGYFLGGGTDTAHALRRHYKDHDRVVILTDEQANRDHAEVGRSMRADRPLYTFNLAGYERGHAPSGQVNRHTFGGLTDKAFTVLTMLESRSNAGWPWES